MRREVDSVAVVVGWQCLAGLLAQEGTRFNNFGGAGATRRDGLCMAGQIMTA
jgi:hypothetical protein